MSQLTVVLTPKRHRSPTAAEIAPTEVVPVVFDLTRRVFAVKFSTSLPGGFMQATLSLLMRRAEAYEWYERYLFRGIEIHEAEQPMWEGRITSIALRDHGIDLTCEGYWASLADVRIAHAVWSDNDMSKWRTPSGWRELGTIESEITLDNANDKYLIEKYEHLFSIGTRKDQQYLPGDKGVLFYRLPRPHYGLASDSIFQPQRLHSMMYSYDIGTGWSSYADLIVYTAWNPQGTWELREIIQDFGTKARTSGIVQSGTRVLPLVNDVDAVKAVAFGVRHSGNYLESSDDWETRVLFTNVMLWAENWPLTARRSTNKKVITDLLSGNTALAIQEKAMQLSNDPMHIDESDADFAPLAFENETLQDIVAKLGETGVAESKGFQFKQGTYTGDGTTDRAITGIGFTPKVVMIKGNSASNHEAAYRSDTMGQGVACIDRGVPVHIESFDADGFTVSHDAGDTARVNENGVAYYWYCFGGSGVETGTYTGDSQDNHLIPLGFPEKPDMVWILPATATPVRWAIAGGAPDYTMPFAGGVAYYTNEIKEMLPGEFKLGNDVDVNNVSTLYHYVAFAPTPALITGLYKGNGYDGYEHPDLPIHFLPDLLNIKRIDAGANYCVWCTAALNDTGDVTFNHATGVGLADRIQGLKSSLGQWFLGGNAEVNLNLGWYYFFACVEGTYPDIHNIEYIPANVGVFGRQKLHFKKRDRTNIRWVVSVAELGTDGLELERTVTEFWARMWASYVEPVTQFQGWLGGAARTDLAEQLWHRERYTTIDTGNVPASTAESIRSMRANDAAKPTQRTALTLTGLITNVVGALEPLWRVRAGDLIFLRDLSILPQLRPDASSLLDSLRVFTIKETEYDVEQRSLSITLDYAPEVLDLFVARTELTLAPYALGSPAISSSLLSTLQGGWH